MLDAPSFPPLIEGRAAVGEPLGEAAAAARAGCDAGLLLWRALGGRLEAALVLAPEVPLEKALEMVPVLALGFSDAFGALAPSEIGVHFEWPGTIRVDGAVCGRLRAASGEAGPEGVPAWLVVGIEVEMERQAAAEPGAEPDRTSLAEIGAAVDPLLLVEAWARHGLHRIAAWEDGERARLHAEWSALAWRRGESVTALGETGRFVGLDEHGGLLLETEGGTVLLPLARMLEPC